MGDNLSRKKYWRPVIVLVMACGFLISQGCQTPSDEPEAEFQLQWNTFLGGSGGDLVRDIAVDSIGNIYIVGDCDSTWGNPLNPFTGRKHNAYAAKLNPSGELQWHTFFGDGGDIWGVWGQGIAIDNKGNIYIIGSKRIDLNNGISFVAKLDANGALQWNVPISVYPLEVIAVDDNENIYIVGQTTPPGDAHTDVWNDTYVYKFNSDGVGKEIFYCSNSDWMDVYDIALDNSGNIYLAGVYNAGLFVGKLDLDTKTEGNWQWFNTLGGYSGQRGTGIALDNNGSIYVTGVSEHSTWGNPLEPRHGESDAFVAKLNANNGALQWNTFMGGESNDAGIGVALDKNGNIYVSGRSTSTWGSPLDPYHGGEDVFVAELSANGALQRNTFLGGSGDDFGRFSGTIFAGPGIALDNDGNIYVAGNSDSAWGSPLNSYSGGWSDAFVAQLSGHKQN